MTQHKALFAALAAPFEAGEVKVRNQAGRELRYVTARTVMNRLDNVLGPENWFDAYHSGGDHSIVCLLTLRLPGGQELTKCDAGGFAGMSDAGDDDKSGYSDAFKRAAVKFGVARYLYRDGVPSFGPDQAQAAAEPSSNGHGNGHAPDGRRRRHADGPETGRALFAWTREQEQRHGVGLFKRLTAWAKLQDFPGRMVDFTPEQVALALAEARGMLEELEV